MNKEKKDKSQVMSKIKKSIFGISTAAIMAGSVLCFSACGDVYGEPGQNGRDGTRWYSGTATPTAENTQANVGDFYYDEDDNIIYKLTESGWVVCSSIGTGGQGTTGPQGPQGEQGKPGEDGLTPYIKNGNWWIGTQDTGVKAEAQDGQDGQSPTISINADGYWVINGTVTSVKAQGQDGQNGEDGATPHIGSNGNWFIGNQDTGYSAIGKDGKSATISIDNNGYFIIDGQNTGYIAGGITNQQLYEKLSNIIEYDSTSGFELQYESVKDFYDKDYLWHHDTSTFSGWGGSIGNPEEISILRFKVKARDEAITSINVSIQVDGYNGTVLNETTLEVNIAPNTVGEIVWKLNAPFVNADGKEIYFKYKCDKVCTAHGSTTNENFLIPEELRTETNNIGYFTTASNYFLQTSNKQYAYLPIQIGTASEGFKISDKVLEQIKENLNINEEIYKNTSLAIPSIIYGSSGQTLQIYFRNICAYSLDDVYIDIAGKGKQYNDRWEYIAQSEETFNLTISVFNKNWELLNESIVKVEIKNPTKSSVTALVIGDSTVNAMTETKKMLDIAASDENFNLTLLGSRGSGDNKHEGRGGWTAYNYVNTEKTDVYTNAFYNPEKRKFDFAYYMTEQGYDGVDVVFLQLGINDIFSGSVTTIDGLIDRFVTNMQFIIENIHEYDANIKIVVNLVIPCEQDQDKFTQRYETSQTVWGYMRNMYKTNMTILENFTSQENIYVSWYNAALDAVNNQGGDVHPAEAGYNQLGTQMYYFLKAIV